MPNEPAPLNLPQLFLDRVRAAGSVNALLEKRGGAFAPTTWDELHQRVMQTAAALVDQVGVTPGDHVVQISENRSDWFVTDMAILLSRAVHVPLHSTLAAAQLAAQIVDCGARVVIVSGEEQAAKLSAVATGLPPDVRILSHDAGDSAEHFGSLVDAADADAARCSELEAAAVTQLRSDDLATILYTSGTTGEPKGVMLSHGNVVGNAIATLNAFAMRDDDLRLSFLPWSHIFARTCGLYTWIASGATLAIAESREEIVANCQELKPTLLNGVPYFFDKLHRALAAVDKAEEPDSLQALLGGRMRMCCSGGAALPVAVAEWFERQGVPLIEGYGLTETSPVISCCRPDANRIGTVGPAVDDAEIRIAADGEVLTRGPYVMQGYYRRPEATAEVIRDGWFYTGDLGHLDADGFLTITGRKKEILVTAAGKNVAPVQLEALLTADPLIDQAVVLGDGRNYLVALVVPNRAAMAAEMNVDETALDLAKESVRSVIETRIATALSGVSHSEQVRRFALLDREFSIERGELTPTLKLRRHVIVQNFATEVAALYNEIVR